MKQVVTYMPCVQVVYIVGDALVTLVYLKPTLQKFINLPLELKYLFVSQIVSDQKQNQSLPAYSPMHHFDPSSADSYADMGHGPSSIASLQPHPFNVIISDFQQRKCSSQNKKNASITDFI